MSTQTARQEAPDPPQRKATIQESAAFTVREEFEAWIEPTFLCGKDELSWDAERNCYVNFRIHLAWKAWQAAYASGQESMRAKLDKQWNDGFDNGKAAGRKAGLGEAAKVCKPHDDDDSLDAQCKRECAAAIRALSNAD